MSRMLGLDLGDKRIGVALTDELLVAAHPFSVIERKSKKEDIAQIRSIIESQSVDTLIIGLPRNMDGTYGDRAKSAQKFAALLEEETRIRVILYDERLTTTMATRSLIEADMSRQKRKANVDKVAAQIILQAYLDSERSKRSQEVSGSGFIDTHNMVG